MRKRSDTFHKQEFCIRASIRVEDAAQDVERVLSLALLDEGHCKTKMCIGEVPSRIDHHPKLCYRVIDAPLNQKGRSEVLSGRQVSWINRECTFEGADCGVELAHIEEYISEIVVRWSEVGTGRDDLVVRRRGVPETAKRLERIPEVHVGVLEVRLERDGSPVVRGGLFETPEAAHHEAEVIMRLRIVLSQ